MKFSVDLPDPDTRPTASDVDELIFFFRDIARYTKHAYRGDDGKTYSASHLDIDTDDVTVNEPVGFLRICVQTFANDGWSVNTHATVAFRIDGSSVIGLNPKEIYDTQNVRYGTWVDGIVHVCTALNTLKTEFSHNLLRAALEQFVRTSKSDEVPVEQLDLTPRQRNLFRELNILTVKDLLTKSEAQLRQHRVVGDRFIATLNATLENNGYPVLTQ